MACLGFFCVSFVLCLFFFNYFFSAYGCGLIVYLFVYF